MKLIDSVAKGLHFVWNVVVTKSDVKLHRDMSDVSTTRPKIIVHCFSTTICEYRNLIGIFQTGKECSWFHANIFSMRWPKNVLKLEVCEAGRNV